MCYVRLRRHLHFCRMPSRQTSSLLRYCSNLVLATMGRRPRRRRRRTAQVRSIYMQGVTLRLIISHIHTYIHKHIRTHSLTVAHTRRRCSTRIATWRLHRIRLTSQPTHTDMCTRVTSTRNFTRTLGTFIRTTRMAKVSLRSSQGRQSLLRTLRTRLFARSHRATWRVPVPLAVRRRRPCAWMRYIAMASAANCWTGRYRCTFFCFVLRPKIPLTMQ